MNDTIYFAKVKENAVIPERKHWNAGIDIYACFDQEYIIIQPHQTVLIPTGIASIIPVDYYIQIQERGSSGNKGIKYSAGVIDSSYRGEWFMATTNINDKPVLITKIDINNLEQNIKNIIESAYIIYPYGKAIFQGIVHSVHNELKNKTITYDELKNFTSERGSGKLGSSGK